MAAREYVQVSRHALDQARDRFPDLRGGRQEIATDVLQAVNDGRMATRAPAFAVHPKTGQRARGKRNRDERDRTMRFVWTPDEQRVYLIDRCGRLTTVVTAIRPTIADTRPGGV